MVAPRMVYSSHIAIYYSIDRAYVLVPFIELEIVLHHTDTECNQSEHTAALFKPQEFGKVSLSYLALFIFFLNFSQYHLPLH